MTGRYVPETACMGPYCPEVDDCNCCTRCGGHNNGQFKEIACGTCYDPADPDAPDPDCVTCDGWGYWRSHLCLACEEHLHTQEDPTR